MRRESHSKCVSKMYGHACRKNGNAGAEKGTGKTTCVQVAVHRQVKFR